MLGRSRSGRLSITILLLGLPGLCRAANEQGERDEAGANENRASDKPGGPRRDVGHARRGEVEEAHDHSGRTEKERTGREDQAYRTQRVIAHDFTSWSAPNEEENSLGCPLFLAARHV